MAATLTVDLNARIAQFEIAMRQAMGSLDKFGARGNAVAGMMKTAFAGLGASLSVGTLVSFAKSGIDAADALKDMSERLSVSVKDLASLKLAAEQSGTSLEGVGTGIAKLSKSIGQAQSDNKEMAKALKDLGVTARDPKEALFQLADAVQKMEDPNKRATLLTQVLGKSYGELVPFLKQGAAALRESASESETYAQAMARLSPSADKFNDNLAKMKLNAAGVGSVLLSNLLPALNEVYERIGLVKNLIGAGGLFGTLGATAFTGDTAEVNRRIRQGIKDTESAIAVEKSKGKDTSGFEEKLRGLNAQLVVMKENSRAAALALGEQFKDYKVPQVPDLPANDMSAQLDCIESGGKWDGKRCIKKSSKTSKINDPLASLLGQTEIVKLQEFDKMVGLLNARFDDGRKNTELYTQAMTQLIETVFSANFSEFDKQQKDAIEMSKDWAAAQAEFAQAAEMAAKAAEQDAAAIATQVIAQREHNEEIGLSAAALNELEQARFDVTIAALKQHEAERVLAGASNDELDAIWDKIDALKELKKLRGEGATADAAAKGLQKIRDEWEKTSDDIEKSLTDALMRGFEGGKDWASNFVGTLKNMFSTLVLRPIIQPIAQAGASLVTGALGLGGSGAAQASGLSGYLNGASLYSNLSGLASNALSYGAFGTTTANVVGSNMVISGSAQHAALVAQGAGGGFSVAPAAAGSMAAYGGALGGALYGYEKGGVRGGVIGGVAGYVGGAALAGGAAAFGGGAAAIGTGALVGAKAALAAIGPWGWVALAALAIFGGGKKKPSDKTAYGSVDLETGGVFGVGSATGKKFSQANNDAVAAGLTATSGWAAGLRELGATIVGSVDLAFGSRDGLRANLSGGRKVQAQTAEEFFPKLFDAMTESATELDQVYKNLIVSFDGTAEKMLEFMGALVPIRDYLIGDLLTDVADQINKSGRTAWQIWGDGNAELRKLAASFDGSLASAQALGTASQSMYQMELNLVGQIQGLLLSTSALFGDSIEQIKLSVLDEAQKYDYWRTATDAAFAALMIATDPAEIIRLSGQVNQGVNSAYGFLDETQKVALAPEFIAYLEGAKTETAERLNAAQDVVLKSHKDIADIIKTSLESAATVMMSAAQTQLDAAQTPVVVDVNVNLNPYDLNPDGMYAGGREVGA